MTQIKSPLDADFTCPGSPEHLARVREAWQIITRYIHNVEYMILKDGSVVFYTGKHPRLSNELYRNEFLRPYVPSYTAAVVHVRPSVCKNCIQPYDAHVENKCLFGPREWADGAAMEGSTVELVPHNIWRPKETI